MFLCKKTTQSSVLAQFSPIAFAIAFFVMLAVIPLAAQSPQRIISAAPSITEMLYALGLGDRVVGVTEFCHYPPEVRQKPKIGSYMRPNLETIVAMRPDLVVVLRERGELVAQLRRVGLRVLDLQHNTLEGIFDAMLLLGRTVGVEDVARDRVAELRAKLEVIRSKASALPRRKVMFVIGRTPGTIQDLMVVGRQSFLNELITIAGGQNIFQEANAFYPRIPREEIYARGPQVIIDMGDMADTDRVTEEHKRSVPDLWKTLVDVPAVKDGRVYPVAEDLFVVPGPRVVEAAQMLLEMIHPEAAR
jgi:iron complex transport system substrate-binding protein